MDKRIDHRRTDDIDLDAVASALDGVWTPKPEYQPVAHTDGHVDGHVDGHGDGHGDGVIEIGG